jgi:hypothetical protein
MNPDERQRRAFCGLYSKRLGNRLLSVCGPVRPLTATGLNIFTGVTSSTAANLLRSMNTVASEPHIFSSTLLNTLTLIQMAGSRRRIFRPIGLAWL